MRLACRAASHAPSPAHLFPASTLSLNAPSHAPAFAQIHDELLLEAPADEVPAVERLVAEEMRAALPLEVPVEVSVQSGATWAECE